MSRWVTRTVWWAGCVALLACARPAAVPDLLPMPAAPVITRLVPASGPAGVAYPVRLTIEGTGFARDANTVRIGPVAITQVPSSDAGTRLVVFVPKEEPRAGEVPPALLPPGTYTVTVTTANGTSAPALFTLTPAPGEGP